jgi:hypothetical protein
MNESASRLPFARRTSVCIVSFGAASILVAGLMAASQPGNDTERGGASPYTPTKGEWLCLLLNSRQALANSERAPRGVDVHYLYDLSKPDVLRIRLLYVKKPARIKYVSVRPGPSSTRPKWQRSMGGIGSRSSSRIQNKHPYHS